MPDSRDDSPTPRELLQEYSLSRAAGEMTSLTLRREELLDLEPIALEPGMLLDVDNWTLIASGSGGVVYSWFCLLNAEREGRGEVEAAIHALGAAVELERRRGVVIDVPEVSWEGDVAQVTLRLVPPGATFAEQLSFADRLLARVLDTAEMEPSGTPAGEG